MRTISIISQKGGAGKTTIALNLAVAAAVFGHKSVVIDIDPQASAKGWSDHRQAETPVVISAQASRLNDILKTASQHRAHICFIDTSPHSETNALLAARASDLILIPCRPGILDIRGISSSVDLAHLAKRPALVVLNAVPPRGPMGDQAEEAIKLYGIEVAKARISQRASFNHSLTVHKASVEFDPNGVGAQEVKALYKIICNQDFNILSNNRKD